MKRRGVCPCNSTSTIAEPTERRGQPLWVHAAWEETRGVWGMASGRWRDVGKWRIRCRWRLWERGSLCLVCGCVHRGGAVQQTPWRACHNTTVVGAEQHFCKRCVTFDVISRQCTALWREVKRDRTECIMLFHNIGWEMRGCLMPFIPYAGSVSR